MRPASAEIGVVVACNDRGVLERNLFASPDLAAGQIPVQVEEGHARAALALNHGLRRFPSGVVVCAHQDVYFPRGWFRRLRAELECLETDARPWGVLGAVGLTPDGAGAGRAWSVGLAREVGRPLSAPTDVVTLDEIVLVIRRTSGLLFDERLPGFHLYGTDIVQECLARGLRAVAIDNPVVHNSIRVRVLGRDYRAAYRFMQRKWRQRLPLLTTVVPVTRWGWPLYRHILVSWRAILLRRLRTNTRAADVAALARSVGYED